MKTLLKINLWLIVSVLVTGTLTMMCIELEHVKFLIKLLIVECSIFFISTIIILFLDTRHNKKKKLRWTDNLISKFLRQRVYMWDLRVTGGDFNDDIVFRRLRGLISTHYIDSQTNESKEILDTFAGDVRLNQIYHKLKNATPTESFRLARKICANDSRFKIKICYTIKYLR